MARAGDRAWCAGAGAGLGSGGLFRRATPSTAVGPTRATVTGMGETRIAARPRGPLVVEGPFELSDAAGRPIDVSGRKRVLLCRCGNSRTTPLCDGSHNRVDFHPANERDDAR